MTDNEIIKALENLINQKIGCCAEDCAFYDGKVHSCAQTIAKYSLDLINRQQEEIEVLEQSKDNKLLLSLEQENEDLKETIDKLVIDMNKIKTEAIKEFAERLKETPLRFRVSHKKYWNEPPREKMVLFIDDNDIDNIVKEMTESEK